MAENQKPGFLFPFTSKMEELLKSSCHTINLNYSIAEAAKVMKKEKAEALVVEENELPVGMVTQSDLVVKVLAEELTAQEKVAKIMTSEMISVERNQPIFDGMMLMMKHGIRHLLVLNDKKPVGIVSDHDWITFQRKHPIVPVHDIDKAETIEEISNLRKQATGLAKKIFEREGNAASLTALFTEINDRVTARVIEICLESMEEEGKGSPPTSFSWIGMGSEGRKAQTVSTDQDNGIIFDNVLEKEEKAVKDWFLMLAEKVVSGLETCGFPRCSGNIMATNPELCNSLGEWKKKFVNIIANVDPATLLKASIYFDFRHLHGNKELAEKLWDSLIKMIKNNKSFLRHLAGNMIAAGRPPVNDLKWRMRSFFNATPPSFDIKRQALSPLVDASRILALYCDSQKTDTLERLDDVTVAGIMQKQTVEAAKDAFNFILLSRIRHDFSNQSSEARINSKYNPKDLNPLQLNFLKGALHNIFQLQNETSSIVGAVDL